MQQDISNTVFHLAADLVNNTSRHVFLTGKAGTGKTTFLKYIKEHTSKNTIVVAPTGVAAINAGGVTMHSFFQLPFTPFVPATVNAFSGPVEATDKHSLFRNIHFTTAKRELLQELELLIIDEVSMVRCDMLDAMDTILRHFRRRPNLPFGGVQVLYIGDLFQLPPVITSNEWTLLQQFYEGPFFFNARVIKEAQPLFIELKKVYRQNEQRFIDILNRIRDNALQPGDLNELNGRYNPAFRPAQEEKYIVLTTHNRKADVINEEALRKLPGATHSFKAEVQGEFYDNILPTEMNLQLKEGAQVMFIKNDTGTERRFYNGKLARVRKIVKEEITVSFDNGEEDLKVEKETWKNVRYHYNKESNDVEEEELGSFKQFPIRLAWAITIHKSQGLTFEKAVIDAGNSFAAGQVYVALSRCTSLEGMVLYSRIYPNAITSDQRVLAFSNRDTNDAELEHLLKEEKQKFQADMLVKAFNWTRVKKALDDWREVIPGKKLPEPEEALSLCGRLLQQADLQASIAEKFQLQLQQLLAQGNEDQLLERVNKAVLYLGRALAEEVIKPVQEHMASIQYATKVKKYYKEVQQIEGQLMGQLQKLNGLQYADLKFVKYLFQAVEHRNIAPKVKKQKSEKGSSQRDTLLLYREGKSVQEIAKLRNLAASTIEGHLASFIYTGDIELQELVSLEKSESILKAIDAVGILAANVKHKLGPEYTYGEIQAVLNYYRLQQDANKSKDKVAD